MLWPPLKKQSQGYLKKESPSTPKARPFIKNLTFVASDSCFFCRCSLHTNLREGRCQLKRKDLPFKTRAQDEVPTFEQNTKPMKNASRTKLLTTAPLETQRLAASQVARSALQNASSIASMILTTECARGSRDKRSLFEAAFQVKWSRRLFFIYFRVGCIGVCFCFKVGCVFLLEVFCCWWG